ncbi:restriction endonuclease subunit S [Staphylococcus sp. IPLA37010]|uniref:Restriction endonuclease subunit S n=1 Tax=Staphylococcus equorum TaxID=246432 RepID=A0AAW7APW7_9STAP|nr:restriction endonuclease subunit S [Staphylococcus equorum]MDK9867020.1 restriction endonuclease subunit S [Staphylococcus equorum]
MTKEVKNVPDLRFPGFENTWETKKLHQIVDVKDGTHESPKPTDDGYLLVTSKNLKNSTLDFSESYSISKEDYEDINKRSKVEIGDILFGMIGTIGNPILLEKDGFAIKNVALLKTSSLQEREYILNFLKSNSITKQFYKLNVGGTQKFISLRSIRDLKIDIPSSEEAIKIGGFFNKLDRQIELEEQKLSLLEEQKKGYMQQIFSQKLHFKDENGKDYPLWEIKKLGELYKVVMGQSPKSINYTDDNSHPVLVQGNADIYNGNIFPRMYTKEITKLVKKGDILLTVRAPVGEIGIAQFEACMGRGVCSIEGNKFIYYFLEMFGIQNKWQKLSQGSTFESISGNEVRNIEIPIPSPSEREKISDFFSELDHLINMHSQKVDELKLRKQGFLQKMFV